MLEDISTEQAVKTLIDALKDKKAHVLCHSLLALWRIGTQQSREGWHQFINRKELDIHLLDKAFQLIDDNRKVVEDLLEAVEDQDLRLYYKKIIMTPKGIIGSTIQFEDDKTAETQRIFGEILRSTCSEQIVRKFQALIPDISWIDLEEELIKIRSQQLIEGLLQSLNCENPHVRSTAAEVLTTIGDRQVLEGLLDCEDSNVRLIAAVTLRLKYESKQAVAELLQALISSNVWKTVQAQRALESTLNPHLLVQLWQICCSNNTETAFSFISSIQNDCKYYNYEIAHNLSPQVRSIANTNPLPPESIDP